MENTSLGDPKLLNGRVYVDEVAFRRLRMYPRRKQPIAAREPRQSTVTKTVKKKTNTKYPYIIY